MDDIRQRFLRDRVLTATPIQRVVMLYDRLARDLARARTVPETAGHDLDHANRIVAELLGSLDQSVGGPTTNLASLYGYLLREILQAQLSGDRDGLPHLEAIVVSLRDSWASVAEGGGRPNAAEPAVELRPVALAGMSWSG